MGGLGRSQPKIHWRILLLVKIMVLQGVKTNNSTPWARVCEWAQRVCVCGFFPKMQASNNHCKVILES